MTTLTYKIFDVFTETALQGNGLAVVKDADDLSDATMQAVAREFNQSETVFVLQPRNKAHSARVRIFTPANELPFAGHPTVGVAAMLGAERIGNVETEEDALVVLELGVGPIRVGVRLRPGEVPYSEFDLPKMPTEEPDVPTREELSMVLGLTSSELSFENHKPSCFDAGLPYVFVPVHDLTAISNLKVNPATLERLLPKNRSALYVYCRDTQRANSSFHARMFDPLAGITEDPATGSAAAAFAGVIMKFDQPAGGTKNYVIEQGFEIGRPSEINLELVIDNDLRGVRIGGSVVQVAEGTLTI